MVIDLERSSFKVQLALKKHHSANIKTFKMNSSAKSLESPLLIFLVFIRGSKSCFQWKLFFHRCGFLHNQSDLINFTGICDASKTHCWRSYTNEVLTAFQTTLSRFEFSCTCKTNGKLKTLIKGPSKQDVFDNSLCVRDLCNSLSSADSSSVLCFNQALVSKTDLKESNGI